VKTVKKITESISKKIINSEFSINAALNKKEVEEVHLEVKKEENLPEHHFSEVDLQREWQIFLNDLQKKDMVLFYAVNTLKIHKKDENLINILYPSDSVKAEFEKVQGEFFNHFKRKVNNYKIEIEFSNDVTLKKEIVTKKTIFEKFVELNPVLKDLDELLKLDLS
jgi:DNA polymerase-3 subunit gamma/tau